MRKPEECNIEYCGYSTPRTFDEINFELLGLKTAIKKAEERISVLEQSAFLANNAINNQTDNLTEYFSSGSHNDKDSGKDK
jgi:hypothetical protein|tara:strand:+ start:321 stop:563 length:243 start_codon:yes stop_codon:yes gene_type:complete